MATVKGANKTLVDAGGIATIENGVINGRVKLYYDSYTAVGDEASGTIIKMGAAIPAGAKVIGALLVCDDIGSGITLSLGDGNSSARYYSAVDGHNTRGFNTPLVGGVGYEVGAASGDDQIQVLTAGGTLATGKIIKTAILVAQD